VVQSPLQRKGGKRLGAGVGRLVLLYKGSRIFWQMMKSKSTTVTDIVPVENYIRCAVILNGRIHIAVDATNDNLGGTTI
jgi:hypothetical protein